MSKLLQFTCLGDMYNFVHHNISVALTKQTYNTQDRNPKTNTRNPKSKSSKNSLVTSSRQEMDWVYSKKNRKNGPMCFHHKYIRRNGFARTISFITSLKLNETNAHCQLPSHVMHNNIHNSNII